MLVHGWEASMESPEIAPEVHPELRIHPDDSVLSSQCGRCSLEPLFSHLTLKHQKAFSKVTQAPFPGHFCFYFDTVEPRRTPGR